MPTTDERLRDALRHTAQEPAVDDVVARVQAKWQRRRTVRRVEAGLVAACIVTGLAVASVALFDTKGDRQVAVGPGPGAAPIVRVVAGPSRLDVGHRAAVTNVHVTPDEGYVRGPLLVSNGMVAVAAYDRSGASYTFPPSRIIRMTGNGSVLDRVDLKGQILSLSDGEGARWALTRDKTVSGAPDASFRVKRIASDGSYVSNPVPAGEVPVGHITAEGGGVWVPVRDGVLRFDVTTGVFAAKVRLATVTDRRAVASFGKGVAVTDGQRILRLDPTRNVATDDAFGVPAPAPVGWEYVDLTSRPGGGTAALAREAGIKRWLVAAIGLGDAHPTASVQLPTGGLQPDELLTTASDVYVVGRLHGVLVVYRYREHNGSVQQTITVRNVGDVELAPVGNHMFLITSNGSMYRVRLPE